MQDFVTLIIAATIVGVGLVYFVARAVFRKCAARSPGRRARPEHTEKAATVLNAMMGLLEQQRTLSHEITDSLEERCTELKELIRQADEMIARLAARVSTFKPDAVAPDRDEVDEEELPEVGTDRAERAALFGPVRTVSPVKSPLPGSRLSAEEKQRLIYEYADAGMDIHHIAQEMKLGKGEVKLVLSLRQGA